MEFYTVFDASLRGYTDELTFIPYILFFIGIGALLVFNPTYVEKYIFIKSATIPRGLAWTFFLFPISVTLFFIFLGIYHHDYIEKTVLAGNYRIIEGEISNYTPGPRAMHRGEGFTVNNEKFEYTEYYTGNLAKEMRYTPQNYPIHNGTYVRISYIEHDKHVRNVIIKLEIKK